MTDYPALNGQTVTERHARICRERGHATHTVGGVDSGTCPRCGEVTEVREVWEQDYDNGLARGRGDAQDGFKLATFKLNGYSLAYQAGYARGQGE